jgi:hypothetical protein
MTTTTMNISWGLKGVAPDDARAVWGARAIFTDEYMDLLPDRQSLAFAHEQDRKSLVALLNDCGVLTLAQAEHKRLVSEYEVDAYSEKVVTLYRDNVVQFEARYAGGYVYTACWLKPLPFNVHDSTDDEPSADVLTWSCDELPLVGETVKVTMNGIGLGVVAGYAIESFEPDPRNDEAGSNYLYVLARPLDPPEWMVIQNEGSKRADYVHVMGREWKSVSLAP